MAKGTQYEGPAEAKLRMMNYKTLQKEVIIRGYPFEKLSQGDLGLLASFYIRKFREETNYGLLAEYDTYLEGLFKDKNLEASMSHPQLRYSFVSAEKENVVKVTEKPNKPKDKKEKTPDGIYKGTKKALTFKLAKEGLTKAETIEKVLETFPDASSKSMGIWYNKALKED